MSFTDVMAKFFYEFLLTTAIYGNYNENKFSEIKFSEKQFSIKEIIMFIGRKEEIEIVRKIANSPNQSLLLYGKRKVGKTTLLKEALKSCSSKTVYYECVKSSLKDNTDNFVERLLREGIIPTKIHFDSMDDVFSYLNTLPIKINIVIDEYPYLKKFEKAEYIDSVFQVIIDNHLKNISLFVSGSHIGMMKDMLEEKNALYGRFNTVIKLKELNYVEVSSFYPNKSIYDKIAFYSVFGGSPFVNSCLDNEKSLKENIINTILNPVSSLSNYAENLLISDLSSSINAERILFAISNGKKKHKDIEQKLGLEKNGLLSKHLNTMLDMDLVTKSYPINMDGDNKKVYYEINDNLLRFYYTYIYNHRSALEVLGAEIFFDEYIKPSLLTFISHRFEEICRMYFSILLKSKKISGILNIGTFYFDDPKRKSNGEFDVAIKTNNGYEIYEAKYYVEPMKEKEILEEENQIRNIQGLNISNIGFIAVSGVEKKVGSFKYIDGNSLYDV